MKRRKGYFSISAVARMLSVHQQTIRMYEKQGLIFPKRTSGNTRMFSEDDVDRLEEIIHLTHNLGVNLAGVEIIFKLQKKIDRLQQQVNRAFEETQDELNRESEHYKDEIKKHMSTLRQIKDTGKSPHALEDKSASQKSRQPRQEKTEESTSDPWYIEYEE